MSPPARAEDRVRDILGTPSNRHKLVNTYPEYWVDGKPFVPYGGSFFYHRLPRDRWAEELNRLKEIGFNSIDLLTMWNWHEPAEGSLDFDGHTNPRRDLKYALRLADQLGFKVFLRPGPYLTGEWRNGGYPDWLLSRPEYAMSKQIMLEGHYPLLSLLQYADSERAAAGWLNNETHLRYTRGWLGEVLGLARPYFADAGGPIVAIQVDDDQAADAGNYNGPVFWKYMDLLRLYMKEATRASHLPYYLNGDEMRVNADANDATEEPFLNLGQHYPSQEDLVHTKFLLEILKTQPLTIPGHSEFQTKWFPSPKDPYAIANDASIQLMTMSVMFHNGLKLLEFYPSADTLYPAGYETEEANRLYAWDAAVNYEGNETERAVSTRRFGRLVKGMGPLLGSSHLLPDAGLVYPMSTYSQAELTGKEAGYVAAFSKRVLWSAVPAQYNLELIDVDHSPLVNLQRYRVLLLPNLVSCPADQRRYPHLARYSEKAQRLLREYVSTGGTLAIFPSLPKGTIVSDLLGPFGESRYVERGSALKFDDGTESAARTSYTTLSLSTADPTNVGVFARDSAGGVVGARLGFGKGEVVFFGADIAARATLPALMKRLVTARKVHAVGRDSGVYVTELVADSGSLPFEKREKPGFAFVGITNARTKEARITEIRATDPRSSDLAGPAAQRYLRMPGIVLPPRQSLLMPVHVPLNSALWDIAPGLEDPDEITYATAELSALDYDGSALRLEFTAPAAGEAALRLAARPTRASIDGVAAQVEDDKTRNLYIVKIPPGDKPHFIRVLELGYPREEPRVNIDPGGPWIAGETHELRVQVENPKQTELEGELDVTAGRLLKDAAAQTARVPGASSREFRVPVEIPADAPENQLVDIRAILRVKNTTSSRVWHTDVRIHHPFEITVAPMTKFPLREDQGFPLIHPTLVSAALPAAAFVQVRIRNHVASEQTVAVSAKGPGLKLTPAQSSLAIPANAERTVEIRANALNGSGAYRFDIVLSTGAYTSKEEVLLAAVKEGEAIAYVYDYDRDGFDDIVMENARLRMFISPGAGGRAFGFTLKGSGANAFNAVGGMRDSFTTYFLPEELKKLPKNSGRTLMGLANRPYSARIVAASGDQAEISLEYTAPDIYPKGVRLVRTLTLPGTGNVMLTRTTIEPFGTAQPQAYVMENAVPFKVFERPNYQRWFVPGMAPAEFAASKTVDLPGATRFIATVNRNTGEIFAVIPLSRTARWQVASEKHCASLRLIYPDLPKGGAARTYRAAFYLGRASPAELEEIAAALMRDQQGRDVERGGCDEVGCAAARGREHPGERDRAGESADGAEHVHGRGEGGGPVSAQIGGGRPARAEREIHSEGRQGEAADESDDAMSMRHRYERDGGEPEAEHGRQASGERPSAASINRIDRQAARPGGQRAEIQRDGRVDAGRVDSKAEALAKIRQQPAEAEEEREVGGEVLSQQEARVP